MISGKRFEQALAQAKVWTCSCMGDLDLHMTRNLCSEIMCEIATNKNEKNMKNISKLINVPETIPAVSRIQ